MNKIQALYIQNTPYGDMLKVGWDFVSRIEEDDEAGHMARIPIYLVYAKHDNQEEYLFKKVPSHYCIVEYFNPNN